MGEVLGGAGHPSLESPPWDVAPTGWPLVAYQAAGLVGDEGYRPRFRRVSAEAVRVIHPLLAFAGFFFDVAWLTNYFRRTREDNLDYHVRGERGFQDAGRGYLSALLLAASEDAQVPRSFQIRARLGLLLLRHIDVRELPGGADAEPHLSEPTVVPGLPPPPWPVTTEAVCERALATTSPDEVTPLLQRQFEDAFTDGRDGRLVADSRAVLAAVLDAGIGKASAVVRAKPTPPRPWRGPSISASQASYFLGYTSGRALTEFLRSVKQGHWLHELRKDGHARTPNGEIYQSAVIWVRDHRFELED